MTFSVLKVHSFRAFLSLFYFIYFCFRTLYTIINQAYVKKWTETTAHVVYDDK